MAQSVTRRKRQRRGGTRLNSSQWHLLFRKTP